MRAIREIQLKALIAMAGVGMLVMPTMGQKLSEADSLGDKGRPEKPPRTSEVRRAQAAETYHQLRQETAGEQHLVYGADNRLDVYQVSDPFLLGLADATCVVLDSSDYVNNGNGTYTLLATRWTTQIGLPVCAAEPFRNQYQVGFCSGFLVGPDIMVTAGHCVSSCSGGIAFVFDFEQLGASIDPPLTIPADNIYFCAGIINRVQSGELDHCVVQLDRPVVGRNPVPIRRTGEPSLNDPLVVIGHGVVLPTKIDAGGVVKDPRVGGQYFTANLDTYGGNSGSAVFNLGTGVVEGILVRGNSDFVNSGGCALSRVCPDTGCPGFEECSKTAPFSGFVPELGISVTPGGGALHLGVVGGPFTNDPYVYTLSNPTSNAANYTVSILGGGTAPLLLNGGAGPVSGTIPGQSSTNITVSLAGSAGSLGAGTYSTNVKFDDTTNSISTTRTHTLEVGTTGFTVTPANGLSSGGPLGGPFGATQTYTITSTRPTTVNVQVSASASWISVNGGTSPVTIPLTGIGASTNVTIGYSANANSLPNGVHNGTVSITNQSGGSGNTTRPVTLDVGRYSYPSLDVPKPINDYSQITSVVNVPDSYCIADVDVQVNITHTYIGDLIVELQSPTGTIVRLHNRTGGSADDIVKTYDDSTMPPDGPGLLADFQGETVTGVWTLRVSDNAGLDTGTLNSWTLKIASGGTTCPSRVLVHDFPLNTNPGWTTMGQWAWGQPLGIGGDPSSGYTGNNVYGYNLAGQYPNNLTPTQYLTTTAIDCTGLSGTRLEYRRWLGVESATYDHANLQISNNGTTWATLYEHTGSSFSDTSWQHIKHDISAYADNQPTVYLRWGMGTTDSSVTYCGWNIDDIQVWAFLPTPCDPCDTDCNGTVNPFDITPFLSAIAGSPGCSPCAGDTDGNGTANPFDITPFLDCLGS